MAEKREDAGKKLTKAEGNVLSMIEPCPICGRQPDIDECGPVPKGCNGDLGFYASCYAQTPQEHHFGINADSRNLAIISWNACAKAVRDGVTEAGRSALQESGKK